MAVRTAAQLARPADGVDGDGPQVGRLRVGVVAGFVVPALGVAHTENAELLEVADRVHTNKA
ncbi:hypothetical protein OG604_32855 [Streptomyces sp. NBC_01231]|nr:hypothetical protein OG604_32855 [Streptomyces sp. NBC_01231]